MTRIILFITLFIFNIVSAQDITGSWTGAIKIPQGDLPMILHISKDGNTYKSLMDSPMQGVKGIPMTATTFDGTSLHVTLTEANFDYKATYQNGAFKGILNQNGNTLELNLTHGKEQEKPKRPQEPLKPYPYHSEDVSFKNQKAGITLAGTLTLPKKDGNYPAVILITGSGGQNRDEEILGHKPFLVLADYLTKNGIAVLRYDDRGIGQSGGNFDGALTTDFATDAAAAISYLKTRKEINKNKIGLAGHSEGGTVASIVAADNPDVAFVVLLAAGNIPGDEQMVLQNYLIGKAQGMPEEDLTKLGAINRKLYDVIKQEDDIAQMKLKLQKVFHSEMKPLFVSKGVPEEQVNKTIEMQTEGLVNPWYVGFIRTNPTPYLEKIKCPVLALNGDKDVQVAAVANLEAVNNAGIKSGNKKITTKKMAGLNHLFQEADTGLPAEYGEIEQTLSPAVLTEISSWIKAQVK